MEEVSNSTVNSFHTPHPSTNFTIFVIWQIGTLEICVLSFSFVCGLPTHLYVVWLISTRTKSEISLEIFNLSISVCESFFSVYCLLIVLTKWFPSLFLAFTLFLLGVGNTGRPLFQCLICVERYLAVVHPVIFLKFKPLRYRVICSTAAWIICFGSCLCCMFLLVSSSFVVYNLFFIIQFILFLSIQLFCLLAVLRALKQSGPGERGREGEGGDHMKKRAFNIILIITVSMAVTYVPFTVTGFVTLLTQQHFQVLWSISFICFMLAGFLQPVLYLHRTGKLSCLSV